MAPEQPPGPFDPGVDSRRTEFIQLFHTLNNQLGIILANAELLEGRLSDTTHRARAGQVAASALDAIATAQQLRRLIGNQVASSE